jgi:thymidylate synthase
MWTGDQKKLVLRSINENMMNRVKDIRNEFIQKYARSEFEIDKTDCRVIEISPAFFLADEPAIFGKPNNDYISRELEWYYSQSLRVKDIPPPIPKIWNDVADADGKIHSNYGYLIFSKENYNQYSQCFYHLLNDPSTRRAIMIYTRPRIQIEYNENSMSDFICTNTVQYTIRHGKLHAHVSMRSNDAYFGYRNDWAWQKHILARLTTNLNIYRDECDHLEVGDIYWSTPSLHLYESQFKFLSDSN